MPQGAVEGRGERQRVREGGGAVRVVVAVAHNAMQRLAPGQRRHAEPVDRGRGGRAVLPHQADLLFGGQAAHEVSNAMRKRQGGVAEGQRGEGGVGGAAALGRVGQRGVRGGEWYHEDEEGERGGGCAGTHTGEVPGDCDYPA